MKKYLTAIIITMAAFNAYGLSSFTDPDKFSCLCANGAAVPVGDTCPGESTPCGGGTDLVLCATDSDCPSGSDWAPYAVGYEFRTADSMCFNKNCVGGGTSYRCAVGYYGSSTNGKTGCTSCKTATGNDSATSTAGSTLITNCYLPAGTSFSDSTGSGTYTANCSYSN